MDGNIIMGLVFAFGFVTLIFAFSERKGINLEDNINGSWEESSSGACKSRKGLEKGKRSQGVCLSVAFLFFLICLISLCHCKSGRTKKVSIPILNAQTVRSVWFLLIGMVIFGVGRDLFGYF